MITRSRRPLARGRVRAPVDRQAYPSRDRRYLTAIQRRILRAFAENDGKAVIATGGKQTRGEPGLLLLPVKAFNIVRQRGWIEVDAEANAAAEGIGNWRLTGAGRLAHQRGFYIQELGDV